MRPRIERDAADKVARIIQGIKDEAAAWDRGERQDTPSWQARRLRETAAGK